MTSIALSDIYIHLSSGPPSSLIPDHHRTSPHSGGTVAQALSVGNIEGGTDRSCQSISPGGKNLWWVNVWGKKKPRGAPRGKSLSQTKANC